MNDTQNENTNETEEHEEKSDEMVAEDRSSEEATPRRRRGGLLFLFILLMIAGGAVAGWYYQSMWLPQAKDLVASWWPVDEEPDPLAAPKVDHAYLGNADSSAPYVLPAITDAKPGDTEAGVADKVESEPASPEESAPTETQPAETIQASAEPMTESAEPEATDVVATDTEAGSAAVEPGEQVSEVVVGESQAETEPSTSVDAPTAIEPVEAMPAENAAQVVTLQQARQAYWSRNLVMAETMYRQVLAGDDASADAWGELGNVYYMQAKWSQAAEAYAEAAIRLLQKGDYSQAMFMRYIVIGLDPRQAQRVDEQLQRMQAPAQG